MEYVEELANMALDTPVLDYIAIVLGLGLAAFIAYLAWPSRSHKMSSTEGETIMPRHDYLDRLMADMVHDGLSELLLADKITRKEYREWNKKFGEEFCLPDLLPKRMVMYHKLKTTIAKRLADEHGKVIALKPREKKKPKILTDQEKLYAALRSA